MTGPGCDYCGTPGPCERHRVPAIDDPPRTRYVVALHEYATLVDIVGPWDEECLAEQFCELTKQLFPGLVPTVKPLIKPNVYMGG